MRARPLMLAGLAILGVYLFASAPEPLPDAAAATPEASRSAADLFRVANAINASARKIYTARIVGGGVKAGLKFGEGWRDETARHGPLPALFMRAVAEELERDPVELGLFLGSNDPINPSNRFTGEQKTIFQRMEETRAPETFRMPELGVDVGMFPDLASAMPCVTCHNEHKDSPRKDWKKDDVMGASTWTYPRERLSEEEFLAVVRAVYAGVGNAYGDYLEKTESFDRRPEIGAAWPAEGVYALPATEVFLAEVKAETAGMILDDVVLGTKRLQEIAEAPPSSVLPPSPSDPQGR